MTSVGDVVAHRDLGLRLVQSGAPGRVVRWVSEGPLDTVMEHLTEHAFIITEPHDGHGHWRDLVSRLVRTGVSVLGIRRDQHEPPLHSALLQAAGDFRLALVEVPRDLPLAQLSRLVWELDRSDELQRARDVLFAQHRVIDLAAGGTGPAGIVSAVSDLTNRPVALMLASGHLLAATAHFPRDTISAPAAATHRLDVGNDRELVVAGPPLAPEGRAAFTSAAIVLSVEARSDSANTVLERERWGRVTKSIVTGEGDAVALSAVLDPSMTLPQTVQVIVVQGPAETVAEWRALPREGVSRLITRYPLHAKAPHSPTGDTVLAWQVTTPDGLERTLEDLRAHHLDAVVGIPCTLPHAALSRSSAEALLSRLPVRVPGYRDRVRSTLFHAAPNSELLPHLLQLPEARMFAERVLGSLHAPQSASERDLRQTLLAFLELHGQRGPVAKRLGIHRNTLRNRVTTIEQLTGRSLASADDRAELLLALRCEPTAH